MSVDPVTLALTAGSFILDQVSQNKQRKRQDNLANAMTEYNLSKSREAQDASNRYIDQLTPEAREKGRAEAKTELESGLRSSVSGVSGFELPDAIGGKVSADYSRVRDAGRKRTDARLDQAISNLSTIGAPAEAATRDALRFSRTAGDVGAAQGAARSVSDRYMAAIPLAQGDPLAELASGLLSGAARAKRPTKNPAGGTSNTDSVLAGGPVLGREFL